MDNRLYDLPNKISEKDAALFDSVYEKLDKNASASNEEKKRILSSAMRKAGFEMQDNYADITINRFRRKTTIKRIFVIAAAAAALVGAVAATGTLHKVQQFFHQDISPYEDQIMGTAQMVSNDDITMSIDGVIADEVQCRVVLSLTSKTKEGEKILEQLEYASDEYYTDCRKLNEKAKKKTENGMSEEEAHAWYIEQIKKLPPHSFTLNFKNGDRISDNTNREDMTDEEKANYDPDKYFSFANYVTVRYLKTSDYENDKYHYYEMFTFEMNEIDRTKPFIISESGSGLSVELDINEFFDSHRLVSDDPQAFDYAVISPIAVYVHSTQNDIDSGRRLKDGGERYSNEMTEVTVNFTDGTSRTLNNITICKSTDMNDELKQFDTEQERLDYINAHWNDADVTDQTLEANGDQLFDLEKIASVTIDGITYTIER